MKKGLILALAAATFSLGALAQNNASPTDVCRRVSQNSSSMGSECAQIISRGRFEQPTLNVAMRLANFGQSTTALQVMRNGANRRADVAAAGVCLQLADFNNAMNAANCMDQVFDAEISPAVVTTLSSLARFNQGQSVVNGMQMVRDAYFFAPAVVACERLANFNNAISTVNCLEATRNKEYFNGSEGVCIDMAARNQGQSAVECLRRSGLEYRPLPPLPTSIEMRASSFDELRSLTRRLDHIINRGSRDSFEARRIVEDMQRILDEVAAENRPTRPGNGGPGGRPGRR